MELDKVRNIIISQMQKRGETYQSLGEKIGVDRCNVFSSIKNRSFRYDTLKKICDALEIKMQFIPRK